MQDLLNALLVYKVTTADCSMTVLGFLLDSRVFFIWKRQSKKKSQIDQLNL